MAVLRVIEQKIEGLFEGVFGRAFRTHVQPVELARKLAKEMDDHRTVSVSRVYVPNEYTLYLSTDDRAQFEPYERSLRGELQQYLSEHARREGYALLSSPSVLMETDADLNVGEFGIATRLAQPEEPVELPGVPLPEAAPGATMVYRPTTPPAEPAAEPELAREVVALIANGRRHEIDQRSVVIGRSRECDIQLADANVSRRHAELRQEGATYWIVDLDSTNGIAVNGRREGRAKLQDGDTIVLGATELRFERSLS
jgi:FhaA, N-terminal domain/FHA domain